MAPATAQPDMAQPLKEKKSLYVEDKRSFYEQFQDLKGSTDLSVLNGAYPKPSLAANAKAPQTIRYPLSDVVACKVQRPLLAAAPKTLTPEQVDAQQNSSFFWRTVGFVLVHSIFFTGCWFTFTWSRLAIGLAAWTLCICFGINMCYHRLLAHRSFRTSPALEYLLSYFALHSMQGPPLEWVSNHRYHHLHCDTPLDLHSPYEGFWHAHMGWLFRAADVERSLLDRSNVKDLAQHAFYRWLEETWVAHMLGRFFLTWYVFGWGAVVWTNAFPILIGWHFIFLVNSASHLWGRQPYDTGDLSRNNWWVALLAFGEGWHNTHHAFAHSARHGLEWYELDPCYYCICGLKALGLVWDIRLPSEAEKARKRKPDQKQKIW